MQGFTFGFEVNEDLLKENVGEEKEEEEEEERLLEESQDSNGDSSGAVIPQNSLKEENDNVMMKNLLSLTTSKSQDNDSNRSSEPLKSDWVDEVEEENSGLEEEERGLRKDKGICLDFSTFHEEEIDVNKFNYDVILGFVSKGTLKISLIDLIFYSLLILIKKYNLKKYIISAWEMVNMELKTGSPTIYYSS